MKKSLMILIAAMTIAATAAAQPRAIGLRLGSGDEVSYQHSISEKGFLQADAGFYSWFRGIELTATYNHILFTPSWTEYGEWNFSVGGGIGGGYAWSVPNALIYGDNFSYGWIGLVPVAQLSFKFEFPLQLAVDFRPNIGVDIVEKGRNWVNTNGSRVKYHTDGLYDLALSVRYTF
ncbi:MAG: hypothetical protein LBB53_04510 [Prevotellaceae bacterium]|jgi:hypothetical protein|nr:hypothetical protein [Prevotellaceae bacterium]